MVDEGCKDVERSAWCLRCLGPPLRFCSAPRCPRSLGQPGRGSEER